MTRIDVDSTQLERVTMDLQSLLDGSLPSSALRFQFPWGEAALDQSPRHLSFLRYVLSLEQPLLGTALMKLLGIVPYQTKRTHGLSRRNGRGAERFTKAPRGESTKRTGGRLIGTGFTTNT